MSTPKQDDCQAFHSLGRMQDVVEHRLGWKQSEAYVQGFVSQLCRSLLLLQWHPPMQLIHPQSQYSFQSGMRTMKVA